MNNPKPYLTSDGSHTILSDSFKETYHSTSGAIAETQHVFIDAGLKAIPDLKTISIFDVGFGTGLNVLMTFLNSKNINVNYFTVEPYPIAFETAKEFNFVDQLKDDSLNDIFEKIHASEFNKEIKLSESFTFTKSNQKLEDVNFNTTFDLIYFDAFAPDTQPELWTEEIFKKLFDVSNSGCVLVTYSAKGQVRRNMQAAGFKVERLAGCPPKREMLRGKK